MALRESAAGLLDWPTLEKMYLAGVIEEGYYRASKLRGYSSVRLPWIKKEKSPTDPMKSARRFIEEEERRYG